MSPRHPLQNAALAAALVATVPYLVLKLMWLSGSNVGMTDGGHIDEMQSTRFQVATPSRSCWAWLAHDLGVDSITAMVRPDVLPDRRRGEAAPRRPYAAGHRGR